MALKDILVGLDPSSAGESRLKLALNGRIGHTSSRVASRGRFTVHPLTRRARVCSSRRK